jgi:hypothetical protein
MIKFWSQGKFGRRRIMENKEFWLKHKEWLKKQIKEGEVGLEALRKELEYAEGKLGVGIEVVREERGFGEEPFGILTVNGRHVWRFDGVATAKGVAKSLEKALRNGKGDL